LLLKELTARGDITRPDELAIEASASAIRVCFTV
jgi:hypothetical protein